MFGVGVGRYVVSGGDADSDGDVSTPPSTGWKLLPNAPGPAPEVTVMVPEPSCGE